jgi:hypothetical protein
MVSVDSVIGSAIEGLNPHPPLRLRPLPRGRGEDAGMEMKIEICISSLVFSVSCVPSPCRERVRVRVCNAQHSVSEELVRQPYLALTS